MNVSVNQMTTEHEKKKVDRDEEVAPTPTLQTQLRGIIRRNCSPATKNKSKVNKFKPWESNYYDLAY